MGKAISGRQPKSSMHFQELTDLDKSPENLATFPGTTNNVIMHFEYVKFVMQEKLYNYLFSCHFVL